MTITRGRNFAHVMEKPRIAQPLLNCQIQQLADELDVDLIDSTSRPVTLTEPGRLLFEQAVRILDHKGGMKAMIRRLLEAEMRLDSIGITFSA